jgi:hypothetical protein
MIVKTKRKMNFKERPTAMVYSSPSVSSHTVAIPENP